MHIFCLQYIGESKLQMKIVFVKDLDVEIEIFQFTDHRRKDALIGVFKMY